MKNNEFLEMIKKVGNTENILLDELRQKVGFAGTAEYFRILCWRNQVPYARGYRGRNSALMTLLKLKADKYNFKKATLTEIKQVMQYKGGLDGLANLLKKHSISWRKPANNQSIDHPTIMARIGELGDTSGMTPVQIFTKIGIEIQNPAQYLQRMNVPYKQKRKRTA